MTKYILPFVIAVLAYFFGQVMAEADQKIVIKELIKAEALVQGVDPKLAVSIAMVESSLRQSAVGSVGEIGVFQLRPEMHKGDLHNLSTNVREGVRYLKEVQKKCPVSQFAICYNQGTKRKPKHPESHPYYKKVMKVYAKMEFKDFSN